MPPSRNSGRWSSVLRIAGNAQDLVTNILGAAGMTAIGLIAVIYCYEVLVRYAFNAPTDWAYDAGGFLLCAGVFLMAPLVTREKGHVAIDLALGPQGSMRRRSAAITSALVCLLGAWFTVDEITRQVVRGTLTNTAVPIPKWWITMSIPYGLLGSGFYFLRLAFRPSDS